MRWVVCVYGGGARSRQSPPTGASGTSAVKELMSASIGAAGAVGVGAAGAMDAGVGAGGAASRGCWTGVEEAQPGGIRRKYFTKFRGPASSSMEVIPNIVQKTNPAILEFHSS